MKTAAISRFVVMAAIAALGVVGGSTPLLAQVNFSPNFSTAVTDGDNPNLKLNGSAALTNDGTVLELTPAVGGQAGSAWFTSQQPVAGGFSTTFKFQFTGGSNPPADGIAFVIQNSSLAALGQGGGSIGYADGGILCGEEIQFPCDHDNAGIPNSLAIEFDTYNNGADTGDPNANHIAVQSCGIDPNSPGHVNPDGGFNFPNCLIGAVSTPGVSMSNGHVYTVVIGYAPSTSGCQGTCPGSLTVSVDGTKVLTASVTLESLLDLNDGGKAWVGLTSATGFFYENHDILSWTFTPQAQSAPITKGGAPAVLNFNGGPGNGAFEYDAQLDDVAGNPTSVVVQVKAIPIDEEACEQLVDANPKFGHAQCFVYKNADGLGNDKSLLFELTCPAGFSTNACGNATQKFFATLGTVFVFDKAENKGFKFLSSTIGPYAGWLKGDGGVDGSPCTPPQSGPLFQSNQITSFSFVGDPTATTKGKSGGGGSCWVATYATGGELPPGIKVTSPTFTTYKQNLNPATQGSASYTCSNPITSFKDPTGATGPYLAVASCTQSQAPNPLNLTQTSCIPGQPCTGKFDLSVRGLHVFQVTSKDTGGNVSVNVVVYNVVK